MLSYEIYLCKLLIPSPTLSISSAFKTQVIISTFASCNLSIYCHFLVYTVPMTEDVINTTSKGWFSFPSGQQLYYPSHFRSWTIETSTPEPVVLNIDYNVLNCSDCSCDKIEVCVCLHLYSPQRARFTNYGFLPKI